MFLGNPVPRRSHARSLRSARWHGGRCGSWTLRLCLHLYCSDTLCESPSADGLRVRAWPQPCTIRLAGLSPLSTSGSLGRKRLVGHVCQVATVRHPQLQRLQRLLLWQLPKRHFRPTHPCDRAWSLDLWASGSPWVLCGSPSGWLLCHHVSGYPLSLENWNGEHDARILWQFWNRPASPIHSPLRNFAHHIRRKHGYIIVVFGHAHLLQNEVDQAHFFLCVCKSIQWRFGI